MSEPHLEKVTVTDYLIPMADGSVTCMRMTGSEILEWYRNYPILLLNNLQQQRNLLASMIVEQIAFIPQPPWIGRPKRPWWRIDLRIQDWMEKWDKRFARRRA